MTTLEWRAYEVGHCLHPECSVRKGGRWRMTRFPALAFLIRHPQRGAVLFDTGYSEHFFSATEHMPERLYRTVTPPRLKDNESLLRQLQRDGIGADDIDAIVLSHLHGDHVGGLRDFPSSSIFCAREGWQDLQRRGRLAAVRKGLLHDLLPSDFPKRVRWIEDAPRAAMLPDAFAELAPGYDLFGDGSLTAIELPGHATGHFGLFFHSSDHEPVLLVADAVWSSRTLRDGVPPPAMVTSWLGDTDAYRTTLERLARLHRAWPQLRMVPSHCAEHRP
ncbi:MBL fold metallo-hydrolase [Oleiagrimonas citrea]|uniref:MBL fold metallo-hydrolase n=1 Tax=Oleiagrimonas citrea TaxID=1665687 RepID=A0A846ZQ71_9GAMM|nr:MBL fold metallo-hydrolase [Oleiagrimonas citrea]NKZ39797.1 MBL fold metallo-hydrolase [Oleiagrimonas citrea]